MSTVISTAALASRRALLPLVGEWFVSEWPSWYGPGGPGNLRADLEAYAASDLNIPMGLLAFSEQVPVGIGVLKTEPIPGYERFGPWVGAGYVVPNLRRRGVGAALVAALVGKASELGHKHVYCGTSTSESLLRRSGWSVVETTVLEGKALTVFRSAA